MRVLITSGPTHEPIDDVRYVGNRSSGRLGAHLAAEGLARAHSVTVVSGPVSIAYPEEATVVRVESALEMLAACRAALNAGTHDALIGAAAVADYRPKARIGGKRSKPTDPKDDAWTLELVRNPDILATLHAEFPAVALYGFALEVGDGAADRARSKRAAKGLRAVFLNDASSLGSDSGRYTCIDDDGESPWLTKDGQAALDKAAVAQRIWDRVTRA
jgi:phosphopantothenoylcysteine decarboxylase/phosphopantothenate--cysteine ligase